MDGKIQCSLAEKNSISTAVRHLENRVTETEAKLDNVEQQVVNLDGDLQEALTDLEEKVETEYVEATALKADIVDATSIEVSDNINTPELTATTISAETIDVDNLENVNVLHGKTVDVERTIATIGQFTETQTTTANNGTTNTEELNVSTETNLTGQVNIDGNMTFTKDNGLSKLQGNYLEIDAANIVIDNKNSAEYALYVPGVDGDALFGGSVAVQDTLAAKNLIVTGETHFSNLTLNENTILENPTLERIAQTEELTDKALDIDENGKIVRKFVAGGSAGTVANALIASETRYNYGLLDKYKPVEGSSNYHVMLSDTAEYVFNTSGEANAYLENSNGQRYEFENSQTTGIEMLTLGIAHNNVFYIVVPTLDENENVISAELRKINLNNMQVEYSIDVSEYFDVNVEDLGTVITWLPSPFGNVLSEDKPVLAIAGTNNYVDLTTGTLSTRDENFASGTLYYLSKTNTWYELGGNTYNTGIWATNNKYSSIEDTALIDEPYLEGDNYITDAPAFSFGNETFRWISNGVENELALNDNNALYRDENNNKVLFTPSSLYFNGTVYYTNLYNYYGYVVNEYVGETPYQVEKVKIDRTQADFTDVPVTADTITINDKATIEDIETSTIDAEVVKTIDAEIDNMTFYRGKWYDKVFSSAKPLVDYILDTTDKSPYQTYNILFTGNVLDFRAVDLPDTAITSSQVIGTYKVYSDSNDDVRELNFVENGYDPLDIGFHLFSSIYFYGFETQLDVVSKDNTRCLHLNNCTLHFKDNYGANTSVGIFKVNKCNNVNIMADVNWPTTVSVDLSNCKNVEVADLDLDTNRKVDIRMRNCNGCFVAVGSLASEVLFVQDGGGSNLVVHYQTQTDGTRIEPSYQNY